MVIAADTLRPAYLGCYGNGAMHTSNLDRLAAQSIRFTRAYPETLPTIPTRRTVHGGRRVYSFADYRPVPWDNVYIPGWQPLARDEPTVAEALDAAGYHTGFVADVPHYFVPGMNFTRGFRQWQFVRGQAEDRLGAESMADPALLPRYRGRIARRHLVTHRAAARRRQPRLRRRRRLCRLRLPYLPLRHHVWYRDRRTWFFSSLDFADPRLFDLETDPKCRDNVAERLPERAATARERILPLPVRR